MSDDAHGPADLAALRAAAAHAAAEAAEARAVAAQAALEAAEAAAAPPAAEAAAAAPAAEAAAAPPTSTARPAPPARDEHAQRVADGYTFTGPMLRLGALLSAGDGAEAVSQPDVQVGLPLTMLNRHGLVAGATGTGKTRTLQLMAEELSTHGVPVFVADIKGDLSGMAVPGAGGE